MAIVAGVLAGNPADTTLGRAIVAMIGCYFASLLIGRLAEVAIQDSIRQFKDRHPMGTMDAVILDDESAPLAEEAPPADEATPAARQTQTTETRNAA